MGDWFQDNRAKIVAAVVIFHVGLTVGLVVAAKLGRTQVST